jgi:hypothetical protein
MLVSNESFVVIKLNTGEQIMGILEQEDATHIQILDPMLIRTIPILSEGKEHVTAHPYCQFTSDNVFDIDKRNIIFMKPLLRNMIPHYLRIVKQHEMSPVLETEKRSESLDLGGGETITKEEAIRRIEMLRDILEVEEEIETNCVIEGNDTLH